MSPNLYNGLTLAYVGDAIFEVYMRNYALEKGLVKVKNLHQYVVPKVSNKAEAKYINYLIENNYLSEDEVNIFLKGRNAKIHTVHKNLDEYHAATGFEALIGYLYLEKRLDRLAEIINLVKELV